MKYIFLIAFAIFSVNLYAQENNPFLFTFNHQALPVSDLQKTGDFYVTILGFKEIEVTASQTIPKRWVQNHEGKQLHLITSNDGAPNTIINHMAFSTSNFDTFVKHEQYSVLQPQRRSAEPCKSSSSRRLPSECTTGGGEVCMENPHIDLQLAILGESLRFVW